MKQSFSAFEDGSEGFPKPVSQMDFQPSFPHQQNSVNIKIDHASIKIVEMARFENY